MGVVVGLDRAISDRRETGGRGVSAGRDREMTEYMYR